MRYWAINLGTGVLAFQALLIGGASGLVAWQTHDACTRLLCVLAVLVSLWAVWVCADAVRITFELRRLDAHTPRKKT